jgi:hypothetical protein
MVIYILTMSYVNDSDYEETIGFSYDKEFLEHYAETLNLENEEEIYTVFELEEIGG